MFNFGNNVDRDTVDKVDRAATVDCWQTGDKLATKSKVLETNRRQSRQWTLSPIYHQFWRLSTLSPVCTGLIGECKRYHVLFSVVWMDHSWCAMCIQYWMWELCTDTCDDMG